MKKWLSLVMLAAFMMPMGCTAYSSVAVQGDKAVVAKNNVFLFGLFRRAFVCKNTQQGLQDCEHSENP